VEAQGVAEPVDSGGDDGRVRADQVVGCIHLGHLDIGALGGVLERLGLSDVDQRMVEAPPPIPFDDDVKRVLVDALERVGDGQ
jgi:hypothetical protein